MRILIALLIGLSALLIPISTVQSQPRICRELVEMARGGDARDLRRELRETIKAADNRRCLGFFFRNRDRSCRSLVARIDRLEHALQRGYERPRLSDRQLRTELSRHGCLENERNGFAHAGGSGYRTVCVRTCDGYFFPIAYQRNKGSLERDEKVCQGIYGGADAELYYYPSAGSIDAARSLTGESYKDQSYAFRYQREYRPECQNQLQAGLSRVKESFVAATEKDRFKQFAMIPIPVARPPSGDEPEPPAPAESYAAPAVSRVIDGFVPYLQSEETSLAFSPADDGSSERKAYVERVLEYLDRE